MHVSRSCTDLKTALGASAAFAGVLSPATPLHADVLAAKPRAAEPAVSASCLDVTPGARLGGPDFLCGSCSHRIAARRPVPARGPWCARQSLGAAPCAVNPTMAASFLNGARGAPRGAARGAKTPSPGLALPKPCKNKGTPPCITASPCKQHAIALRPGAALCVPPTVSARSVSLARAHCVPL